MRPESWAKMCLGKRRFRTEGDAVHVLRTIAKANPGSKNIPTRAYSCPHCMGFHITRLKEGTS